MRHLPLILILAFLAAPTLGAESQKLRLIVETDAGGDADDQASLVRLLLYSNEFDLEGIIADRPAKAFKVDRARDHMGLTATNGHELVMGYLRAYREVHPNLVKHSPDYPSFEKLSRITVAGHDDTDDGVNLIIAALSRDDPRPVWYGNWGSNSGTTSNLRRALDRLKNERSAEEYKRLAGKLRICTLDGSKGTKQGHEDAIALHIETGYPTLEGARWYHRFRPLTEKAGGFDVERDVKRGHGALGGLYTTPKEGDSWTFVYLIPTGLSNPEQPTWGSWAGRYGLRDDGNARPGFYWANQADTWKGTTSRDNTVARFAEAIQNDFAARLDWCVADAFDHANHPPVPHLQGDGSRDVLRIKAAPGTSLTLSAEGSTDPDGDDLTYRWWIYPEAGGEGGTATLDNADGQKATLHITAHQPGAIHVILEATDSGTPALTRYRRVIVTVAPW